MRRACQHEPMEREPIWICPGCGANHPRGATPPQRCPLCEDERQWVPPEGQRFTTMEALAQEGHRSEVREVEPGLLGIGVEPAIGVGQRALLVRTPAGNLLWDPPAFVDDAAIAAVRAAGGLRAVSSSHPHMYGAIVEWASAFDAEIVLPQADQGWLLRRERPLRTWSGALELLPGATLIQCGGHFPGSAGLHWREGAGGAGALLVGDTIFLTPGGDRVSFIWSAPNRLPLPEREVARILDALAPYRFERIYGAWWKPVVSDGERVLARSAARYVQFLRGEAP